MQHADSDQLALIALGEPLADDAAELTAHLERCDVCRREIDTLRQTVTLARETVEYRGEVRPPEAVWDRISSELGLTSAPGVGSSRDAEVSGDAPRLSGPDAPGDGPMVRGSAATGSDAEGAVADGTRPDDALDPAMAGSTVSALRGTGAHRASGRRWGKAVAGLVAAVLIGVVGTLVAVRPWQDGVVRPVAASVASLGPVPGGPGGVSGRAVVVQGPDGPKLDISASGLPLQRGYYEVWVFDGKVKMVAVGVLGANSKAVLALPPTLDLRTYHVVDISLEQYDGNQTHSETSVLRGTLTS
ncbi:MAG TPA: anti-sigma factor [Mycobacteriales bacterium]